MLTSKSNNKLHLGMHHKTCKRPLPFHSELPSKMSTCLLHGINALALDALAKNADGVSTVPPPPCVYGEKNPSSLLSNVIYVCIYMQTS